jgi:hypothetical protein
MSLDGGANAGQFSFDPLGERFEALLQDSVAGDGGFLTGVDGKFMAVAKQRLDGQQVIAFHVDYSSLSGHSAHAARISSSRSGDMRPSLRSMLDS